MNKILTAILVMVALAGTRTVQGTTVLPGIDFYTNGTIQDEDVCG